jgi:hypothetical protein
MSITYISGGLLGDFINQLSIINEYYIITNKKGILYISNNIGDKFRNGLEKTYNDLYEIVMLQEYIKEFKIYNNEKYDINLSIWRNYIPNNFYDIIKKKYNISWGQHKWLNNIEKLDEWKDKIIINTTNYRFPKKEYFEPLKNIDLSNYIFVSFSKDEYNYFINNTNININYYSPKSLMELCVILNSCKLLIGSVSAPMCIATALHTNCVYGGILDLEYPIFRELNKYVPCIRYEL